MNRVAPKALVSGFVNTYDNFPALSKRELELVNYALRFCPVKNVIVRLDAGSKRDMLEKLNSEMT